jgi:hypothetical protein
MTEATPKPVCGLVMPISELDGCSEAHWVEVASIVADAAEHAGFETNLVSNADEVGIIQKRIIQNLYDNPIVVCDVSGKNPNVMFELGLRLAFDRPTIILKDDKTSYSFDTSPIEHLQYPRDLRYSQIIDFKEKLSEKIKATHEKATADPNYTTFLKHFGEFTVAKLEKKEVSGQQFLLEEMKGIRTDIRELYSLQRIRSSTPVEYTRTDDDDSRNIDLCFGGRSEKQVDLAGKLALSLAGVESVRVNDLGPNHKHLIIRTSPDISAIRTREIRKRVREAARKVD